MRIGIAALGQANTAGVSSNASSSPQACNGLENFWFSDIEFPLGLEAAGETNPCLPGAQLPVPNLPAPPPPSTQYGSSPTPPEGYTAVQSGTDSNGNPVYVYMPTAQTLQTQQLQAVTGQVSSEEAAIQAANPVVDCTQIWNQLTSSQCTFSLGTYIALAVAGVFVFMVLLNKAEGHR